MTMICLASVLVRLGLATSTIAAEGEEGSELVRIRTAVDKARISMVQAIEIATKEVNDGRPFRAELRADDGQARYEVEMVVGAQRVEVEIDADRGKVIGLQRHEMETMTGHRWIFDKDPPGKLPEGWIVRQNNPTKELATWIVEADAGAASSPNVLNVRTTNGNATYNLALLEKTRYKDLNLTVKVRGNTGNDDQGGGVVWRCKDENNYYVCRINPIENNYRVYKVVNGKRTMLQSVDFETPSGRWFTLRVTMKGDRITCYCDGRKWLEVNDDTFTEAGMIGLWTKADACTSFDNLQAYPIARQADRGERKPEPGAAQ